MKILKIHKKILFFMLFIIGSISLLLFNNQIQTLTFWKCQSTSIIIKIFNGITLKKDILPLMKIGCPIFTYYQPISNLIDSTLMKRLEIWGYAFYAHGFQPIIINQKSAQTRSNFPELFHKFSQYPTINPTEYELSCYIRWLALSEQGGGLLMDYDILPMISSQSIQINQLKQCKWNKLTTYTSLYPMITHGNVSAVEKWIEYMLNFNLSNVGIINGKPHISDMLMAVHAINHNHGIFTVKPSLPFIHYSHHLRDSLFNHMNYNIIEIMTRNQHIYYFLHHDIYLPIPASISPYSVEIVRSLTLCSDVIKSYDDIDLFCNNENISTDICKLITVNGFWTPNDPEYGKCRWKIGYPDDKIQWGIFNNFVNDREPFIIAILPKPEVYLYRLWLYEQSLPLSNITSKIQEFHSWSLLQSRYIMIDAFIPGKTNQTNINSRIKRIINAMRLGQALLITEKFIKQLYQSEGKQGIEKWISAHIGFFLNITEPNIDSEIKQFINKDSQLFKEDYRFYSAIEEENNRWTKDWNHWRTHFFS